MKIITMYKLLEHTADIQIYGTGRNLAELFNVMAQALSTYIFEDEICLHDTVQMREIELESLDYESLLVDWLSKLLYLASVEKLRFKTLRQVNFAGHKMKAKAEFESCLPVRDVKAVTYHALKIETLPEYVQATVTLDI